MPVLRSRTLSVTIDLGPRAVYDFITDPPNLPLWAPGFARSVRWSAGQWIVETADGPVQVEFAGPNALGVADHVVTVRPGIEVLNPVRVLANGDGSEVTFTLFQAVGVSDDQFDADASLVASDLGALKAMLE